MKIELTSQQQAHQCAFRDFADREIIPYADQFDQAEAIPTELITKMAQENYLGLLIGQEYGGQAEDFITYGLLNEEIGRGCSSVRSLLTVHNMAAQAISRWGKAAQKEKWLPQLASGEALGAFALSEPQAGSDASAIETSAQSQGDHYLLTGTKKWITYGQIADLFLLFAKVDGKAIALIVEKDTPGLTIEPIRGLLGTRASMVAEVRLQACPVPKANMLGGPGFGIVAVALSALDLGRYSVAWGSVGIGQACLEACLNYTNTRRQFGQYLKDHQLIQHLITDIVTQVKAARLLCLQAGYLHDQQDPQATNETLVAKYFASKAAFKIAADAVQIHGGNGCSADYPVGRYLRDAKVMEIIEGSHQMQQILIAREAYVGLPAHEEPTG